MYMGVLIALLEVGFQLRRHLVVCDMAVVGPDWCKGQWMQGSKIGFALDVRGRKSA